MSTKHDNRRSAGPVVAVEIGNDWLKILQFERSRRGVSVTKSAYEVLPGDDAGIAGCISDALEKGKFAKVPVICSLPRQAVTVRMLELPSSDLDEITDMVDLQVGQQTPYSREEITFDYMVFGAERGYTKVLLAIVQRSVLRQRFHVLGAAGVSVERMTVSSEGLLNWFGHSSFGSATSGVIILLDVDSSYSDCTVIANGRLVFTRSISVGSDQLLGGDALAREKLADETKRAIVSCGEQLPEVRTGKLVLTGAGPRIEGLGDYLEERLGVGVEAVDSMSGTEPPIRGSLPEDPRYAALSATSLLGIGLAPQALALDLVPNSIRQRARLIAKARGVTAMTALLMTCFVAVSAYTAIKYQLRYAVLSRRAEQLQAWRKDVENINRMRGIIKTANERKNVEFDVVRQLAEIHAATPANVFFETLDCDVDAKRTTLSGAGKSPGDIRTLVGNLEKSPVFSDVGEAGARELNPKTGQYEFNIVCRLETAK